MPVSGYSSSVKISENGTGTSVEWVGTFEAKGDENAAVEMVRGIYTGMIAGARKALQG